MPRKVNTGFDYNAYDDDDYGAYDDYDEYEDDYDNDPEGNGYNHVQESKNVAKSGLQSQKEKIGKKSKLWTCSICTYDNEDSSLFCDMCGAVPVSTADSQKDASTSTPNTSTVEKKNNKIPHDLKGLDICKNKESKEMPQSLVTKLYNVNLNKNNNATSDEIQSSCSTSSEIDHPKAVESYNKRESLKVSQNLATNNTSLKNDISLAYKPEKWMLSDQEHGVSNQLNLAIVGHVDSGKSTLSGRLLHLLGRISKKEMHKYEKEAKQMGKGSFSYAWAMDESNEERERGITMTVAVAYFDSKNYRVVILDSPGHKDFVSNMIAGATQADAAILVIDATKGAFEAGMDGFGIGQTREHAQLIRSFGVEQLIVTVNKMDAVDFSKERFDFIKLKLGTFLRSCGFKESSVIWLPISAMENQNLVTKTFDERLLSWYQGVCLLDAIDSLQPPIRDFSKPFRMPVCDVTKLHNMGQIAASGKIETGAIKSGSKVLVMPSGEVGTVKSIECDSSACTVAKAGDNVAVSLNGIDWNNVMPGDVLCHPDFPVSLSNSLELKIRVLDITTPILVGSQVEFHIHHAKRAARIVKIVSLVDPKSGKLSKTSPRILTAKQTALVEVSLDEAVCVEEFLTCRALGRAFLRSSGNTIAVGVVNAVL